METKNDAHLQEINEEIYKRNLELAVVNKTLSLLRKLYQISLLELDPASLSEKISETVRVDLNLETVGVFLFDPTEDSLVPFKFSKSERLLNLMNKLGFLFSDFAIKNVSQHKILQKVLTAKTMTATSDLSDVWGDLVDSTKLNSIAEASHLKAVLLYPLVAQSRIIGLLLLGLNREYSTLNPYEKDSIKNLIDVIAVALDKAQLYVKLEVANEQLKILDKARADFISIASHQLRTPPATIKWYLAAVLHGDFGPLSDDIKKAILSAEMTNNSLISLIDDLLNASRIERGKLEFIFEPTDIVKITQLTVDQLTPQAGQKKQTLKFQPPKEEIKPVTADKEKLRQVINNFIDNAIKYTQAGGTIEAWIEKTDKDVIVKVKDNGRGIDKESLDGVFEKYNRGGTKSASQGLGLGLYVAKVVVEQHKGRIWAESEGEGKGSTFCLSVPLKSDLKAATYDLAQK